MPWEVVAMAFISYPETDISDPDSAPGFELLRDRHKGEAPNFLRIHGHHPEAGSLHCRLYSAIVDGPSELTPLQRVMIGVVVSQINDSHYWLQHLGAFLHGFGADENLIARLQSDFRGADLPPADREMLEYVAKLTRLPRSVTEGDVETLRRQGFSDGAIHDICLTTAYFALANRIASGLGVELERSVPRK